MSDKDLFGQRRALGLPGSAGAAWLLLALICLVYVDASGGGSLVLGAQAGGTHEAQQARSEHGELPARQPLESMTELHWAVIEDDVPKVRAALEAGVDVEAREPEQQLTALHMAVARSDGEVVTRVVALLLQHGADLNARDMMGLTPLHIAATYCKKALEVSELLLDAGADPNARSYDGATPLHGAIVQQKVDVIRLLLSRGADPAARDGRGLSPLRYGLTHVPSVRDAVLESLMPAQPRIAKLTRGEEFAAIRQMVDEEPSVASAECALGWHPLHHAVVGGSEEVVGVLLRAGADPDGLSKQGFRPLELAAVLGQTDVAQVLLVHGADPNLAGPTGWAPVHWSAAYGHAGVLARLLESGAPVDARTADGSTPLHVAALEHRLGVVEVLLKSGADPDARDEAGYTPGGLAASMGDAEMAERLGVASMRR